MVKKSIIFIFIQGKFIPAGILSFETLGRNSYSTFRYGKTYLKIPEAISLDPVQLPLGENEFQTPEGFSLFNGIRDAGPDKWGRYLLDKKFNRGLDELDYLLSTRSDRAGALAFGDHPHQFPKILTPQGFSENRDPSRLDLKAALNAIDLSFQKEIRDKNAKKLKEFLVYGPSLGGARPKCTIVSFTLQNSPSLSTPEMKRLSNMRL